MEIRNPLRAILVSEIWHELVADKFYAMDDILEGIRFRNGRLYLDGDILKVIKELKSHGYLETTINPDKGTSHKKTEAFKEFFLGELEREDSIFQNLREYEKEIRDSVLEKKVPYGLETDWTLDSPQDSEEPSFSDHDINYFASRQEVLGSIFARWNNYTGAISVVAALNYDETATEQPQISMTQEEISYLERTLFDLYDLGFIDLKVNSNAPLEERYYATPLQGGDEYLRLKLAEDYGEDDEIRQELVAQKERPIASSDWDSAEWDRSPWGDQNQVPASDRIVTLNHNSTEHTVVVEALESLKSAVETNNEFRSSNFEDHERRLADIETTLKILEAKRVRVGSVQAAIYGTLAYLAPNFADGPIGELAATVWELLKNYLGM